MAKISQPATSSSWADLSSEVLNEVFASLSMRATIACESVCSSWYQILKVDPASGVWGEKWTVLNPMSGFASNSITEYGAEFQLPLSEESENGIWLLHRLQGVYQINLGSAEAPLGLHNQLPDNCIAHRLLAKLQQAPAPSLALHFQVWMPLHTVDETLTFLICAAMNTGGSDPERLLSFCRALASH